ncbi:DUF1810 domain-containing protein [Massilia oculi]|uniref:DUF1810 domain-containing protein n=1 Tax=Massilia hydrophila TaxID=3044279 RepID=A0ABS7Y949_9BURK|nr:DUF1810 domain-containing protein [Massilia oculi]MCA1855064.1 DUF1810 domain-containing protein [Massilia oculi]
MDDRFDLERFVRAQDPVLAAVLQELRAGHKRTHWMWFVFPQIAGLGRSDMARRYAIGSAEEAAAYLAHPVLGERLRACADIVARQQGVTALQIFGDPDERKFHSSMTLFAAVAPGDAVFQQCIDRYFGGRPDDPTLARL